MKPLLTIILGLILAGTVHAQSKLSVVTVFKNNREGSRKALVIANQHYQHQKPLENTLRDADSMTVALRYLGFEVKVVTDKTLAQTQDAIDRFVASLQPNDVAFVYYSGHGLGYQLDNYLLPTEFALETLDGLHNRAISTTDLRKRIMDRSVRNLFLVVDACRNEVDAKGNDPFQLVAPKNNPTGTLTAFATDYGLTASYKSRTNKNSLYTESLLLYLRQPLEVQEIFRLANNRTHSQSIRLKLPTQYPHYIPMIYDDYYFLKRSAPIAPLLTPTRDLPVGPAMVFVQGGTFQMGSTEGSDDEKPVHPVTVNDFMMGKYEVTVSEYMQFVEETNNHYPEWLEAGSSYHIETGTDSYYKDKGYTSRRSQLPIVGVNWDDAVAYCTWLTRKTGKTYRLPTEAEWEYAAGGGSSNRTRFGNGEAILNPAEANFDGRAAYKQPYSAVGLYRAKPLTVGSFQPNKLGLYDMTGNVWEWCSNWYDQDYYASSTGANPTGPNTGTFRVLRGGSWLNYQQYCRVAYRSYDAPSNRASSIGFRVLSQIQ